jgi:hypothetical protein
VSNQNGPAASSALELELKDLKPEAPRKRGRPAKASPATWPECPQCRGRFKLLQLHLPNCAMRPAVAPAPAPQKIVVEITSTSVGILIAGGFDLYALKKKDPRWHLDETQAEALGASWKAAIDAYYPDAGSQKVIILLLALANTLEVLKQKMRQDNVARPPTPRPLVHRPRRDGEDNPVEGDPAGDLSSAGL